MNLKPDTTFVLSRTDSIGDVVLTLPMAGFIKMHFPQCRILFLGRSYTMNIVALSKHVDEFINYDAVEAMDTAAQIAFIKSFEADVFIHVFPKKQIAKLAKAAGVPLRVGTTNRIFHWLYCNKLISLSRKNSPLHESQLNLKLLSFLEVSTDVGLQQIPAHYGFTKIPELSHELETLIDKRRYNVILHPKSKGSAKEWGLANFEKLIALLPEEKFKIFVSGTKEDGLLLKTFLEQNTRVTNMTGKLTLAEFTAFINHCEALVAASTGPLHVAAALGKTAIGLFSPKRPIHPGRWMPIGEKAKYLVYDENCQLCAGGKNCDCITKITPQQVVDLLNT